MTSKQEKREMLEFTTSLIEANPEYKIQKSRITSLKDKIPSYIQFTNREKDNIILLLHDKKTPIKDVKHLQNILWGKGAYTGHIFYKNYKDFFERLGKSAKKRDEKSLKNYTITELNKIIHLRDLEKLALGQLKYTESCEDGFKEKRINPHLVYYQPETEKLKKSLRIIPLENVYLDYRHIDPNSQKGLFAKGEQLSIDYKIADTDNEEIINSEEGLAIIARLYSDALSNKRGVKITPQVPF